MSGEKLTQVEIESILNSTQEGVLIYSKDGTAIYCNQAAEKILELHSTELLSRKIQDPRWKYIKPDGEDLPWNQHPACLSLESGQTFKNLKIGISLHKSKGEAWLNVTTTPIYAQNTLKSVSIVFSDITAIIEKERALEKVGKLATLGELSANISHEINNPNAIIFGKSQLIASLLKRTPLNTDKILESLNSISAQSNRITKIIRGLQSLARNAEYDAFESVLLENIIQEVLQVCRSKAQSKGVEIKVYIPSLQAIECRAPEIEQVLINLINNSIDALDTLNPSQNIQKWIRIDGQILDNSALKLSITDAGNGIPYSIRNKILNAFYTTKPSGKRNWTGIIYFK